MALLLQIIGAAVVAVLIFLGVIKLLDDNEPTKKRPTKTRKVPKP